MHREILYRTDNIKLNFASFYTLIHRFRVMNPLISLGASARGQILFLTPYLCSKQSSFRNSIEMFAVNMVERDLKAIGGSHCMLGSRMLTGNAPQSALNLTQRKVS